MKLTPEQKQQRADQRNAERDERLRRFPQGRLHTNKGAGLWAQVMLEHGTEASLTIRLRGAVLCPEEQFPDILRATIRLDDPCALAEFIAALIARYNAMVTDMNRFAAKCSIVQSDTIASV